MRYFKTSYDYERATGKKFSTGHPSLPAKKLTRKAKKFFPAWAELVQTESKIYWVNDRETVA